MSCWASSRRSFKGLASFWVRVWDGADFCWPEVWSGKAVGLAATGTACHAPTIKIATAVRLAKLGRFIVRAEDCLRHSRLYLKASWTWMHRWLGALPAHSHSGHERGIGRYENFDCAPPVR